MAVVEPIAFGPDENPLILEPGDPYSCYWRSEYSLPEFLSGVDRFASPGSMTVLFTIEAQRNTRYRYYVALEKIEEETPRFFRLYTEEFDLTWELKNESGTIIGFIAKEPFPNRIKMLYERTAEVRLRSDDFRAFSEKL